MSNNFPISVLFVDDDDINRYANSRLLRLAGFDVEEAGTGAEALAALERRPDIAVVDVHLPDMSGFALCKKIKSDPTTSDTSVLLMSAMFTSAADQVQGLEGGADGYLTQPFEVPVLRATITALLRVRQAEEKARKLSEEWQTTFDAISDGIWILDDAGHVVRCNGAMAELWSQPIEAMEGRSVQALLAEAAGEISSTDSVREYLATGAGNGAEYEVELRGRWFRVATHAPPDKNDATVGRVQIWNDITQRKWAEMEKSLLLQREQEARKQAEDANRLKDEFLATLSHELRTPLMAIIGWVNLLSGEDLSQAEIRQGLEVIDRNARAQSQIINDLLDVSRVIAGKLQLTVQPTSLGDAIRQAIDSARPSATAKDIRISYDSPTEACVLMGDLARLQQVLWNLLINAVKFTPRGGEIRIRCEREKDEYVLEVTDSGIGIAPEFLPHVFDRFRQQDSSSTRTHGGLGLGLAIVRLLTELHGGRVEAFSEGKDQGTTFRLHFPVSHLSAEPIRNLAPGAAKVDPLAGVKIQVVDDQYETRELLKMIFTRRGATVREDGLAREALEQLTEWKPDILVSDLGMPGEDGFWLIGQMRMSTEEKVKNIPALALSAYADAIHRKRALDAGFDAFASKPITGDELVDIVCGVLEREG